MRVVISRLRQLETIMVPQVDPVQTWFLIPIVAGYPIQITEEVKGE